MSVMVERVVVFVAFVAARGGMAFNFCIENKRFALCRVDKLSLEVELCRVETKSTVCLTVILASGQRQQGRKLMETKTIRKLIVQ